MIMDELLEFCDATALDTGAAGSYFIGAAVDLGVARDIGNGEGAFLVITVDTAPTSGGSATVAFSLVSDAQEAIAEDGSATVHLTTPAYTIASLTAGRKLAFAVPLEGNTYERYLGILQTTAVAALTAGKINAFITLNPGVWRAYAEGSN